MRKSVLLVIGILCAAFNYAQVSTLNWVKTNRATSLSMSLRVDNSINSSTIEYMNFKNTGQSGIDEKSYSLTGALIGLGIGIIATSVVTYSGGSTSLCNASKNQDAINSAECIGISLAGGILTGGLGAVLGSFFKKSSIQENSSIRFRTTETDLSQQISSIDLILSF